MIDFLSRVGDDHQHFALVALAFGLLFLTVAPPCHAQKPEEIGIEARMTTQYPPMLGVSYQVTGHITARVAAGYRRRPTTHLLNCAAIGRGCGFSDAYRVHFAGGSVSLLHQLYRWNIVSAYGGMQGQFLLASAPDRPQLAGHAQRISPGLLAGISARPLSWVAVYVEAAVGYASGIVPEDPYNGWMLEKQQWGFSYLSGGLRITP